MTQENSMYPVSAVILAGGRSSRMETGDKALLRYQEQTFLCRLQQELSCFGELMLSTDVPGKYPEYHMAEIVDETGRCGPIGGICSALRACHFPLLLVVACDLPCFKRDLALRLMQAYAPGTDAVVFREESGRMHPLCALYAQSALPALNAQLSAGDYRMRDALARMNVTFLLPGEQELKMLQNINTPEDFARLSGGC